MDNFIGSKEEALKLLEKTDGFDVITIKAFYKDNNELEVKIIMAKLGKEN